MMLYFQIAYTDPVTMVYSPRDSVPKLTSRGITLGLLVLFFSSYFIRTVQVSLIDIDSNFRSSTSLCEFSVESGIQIGHIRRCSKTTFQLRQKIKEETHGKPSTFTLIL